MLPGVTLVHLGVALQASFALGRVRAGAARNELYVRDVVMGAPPALVKARLNTALRWRGSPHARRPD